MCHFRRIYHFLLSGSNFFGSYSSKRLFSKTCKTPKTAENRDTVKTKVVELGIIFHMHPFKIWKNEKNFFRKKIFFYQNDIEKKFFSAKKIKNRVWYIKMTGSMSRLRLWTLFQSTTTFWGTFGRFFGPLLGGPNRPYANIRQSHLYIV